jgi:hypothetical protein
MEQERSRDNSGGRNNHILALPKKEELRDKVKV